VSSVVKQSKPTARPLRRAATTMSEDEDGEVSSSDNEASNVFEAHEVQLYFYF